MTYYIIQSHYKGYFNCSWRNLSLRKSLRSCYLISSIYINCLLFNTFYLLTFNFQLFTWKDSCRHLLCIFNSYDKGIKRGAWGGKTYIYGHTWHAEILLERDWGIEPNHQIRTLFSTLSVLINDILAELCIVIKSMKRVAIISFYFCSGFLYKCFSLLIYYNSLLFIFL